MKRSIWVLSIIAVAAFVAVIATPPAQAACASPIQFGSGSYPYINYVTAPPTASTNTTLGALHIGRFYEPGKRTPNAANQDEGAYAHALWWKQFGPTYPFYVQGQMDVGVDGCPGVPPNQGGGAAADGGAACTTTCPAGGPNEIVIVLLDADDPPGPNGGDAYYFALRPSFYILDFPEFNMAPANINTCPGWTAHAMQPIPRANVTLSSRVDSNTVALNFSLADVAPGFQGIWDGNDDALDPNDAVCSAKSPYATITGYNICQFEGSSDPGRAAGSWTCAPGPATGPGGASLTNFQVDCTGTVNDKFIATQLRFNGGPAAGGYDSEYVSRSTRVECDPNIAQPDTLSPGNRPRTQQPAQGKAPRR